MTKRQALVAVINMAKRVQLDHRFKYGCQHSKYTRQKKAVEIVEEMTRGVETKDGLLFRKP